MVSTTEAALMLASCSKDIANYCDHSEHAQPAEIFWVSNTAESLRTIALGFAASNALDIKQLYARRLGQIERANASYHRGSYNGEAAVKAAKYFRGLQNVQHRHDLCYHPDVMGMSPQNQLRHYAFHVAKIAGYFAELAMDEENEALREEVSKRRLPDTLLFGIKLSTVLRERLPRRLIAA